MIANYCFVSFAEGEDEFGNPVKPKTSEKARLGLSEYEKNR
jgi:hypothetical protein